MSKTNEELRLEIIARANARHQEMVTKATSQQKYQYHLPPTASTPLPPINRYPTNNFDSFTVPTSSNNSSRNSFSDESESIRPSSAATSGSPTPTLAIPQSASTRRQYQASLTPQPLPSTSRIPIRINTAAANAAPRDDRDSPIFDQSFYEAELRQQERMSTLRQQAQAALAKQQEREKTQRRIAANVREFDRLGIIDENLESRHNEPRSTAEIAATKTRITKQLRDNFDVQSVVSEGTSSSGSSRMTIPATVSPVATQQIQHQNQASHNPSIAKDRFANVQRWLEETTPHTSLLNKAVQAQQPTTSPKPVATYSTTTRGRAELPRKPWWKETVEENNMDKYYNNLGGDSPSPKTKFPNPPRSRPPERSR